MAGIKKEPGPAARRVAGALRHFRRAGDVTTAEVSRRLTALGQPVPETSVTKAEHVTRRVDVDDLVPLSLALGVTPNTLLMPPVARLGTGERHQLTPAVSGTAEQLWQWAQGERPLYIPGAESWLGDGENPDLEFSFRCRPYLTALHAPGTGGTPDPFLRNVTEAVIAAMKAGVTGTEVRRTVELTIILPAVMTQDEIARWQTDGARPGDGANR